MSSEQKTPEDLASVKLLILDSDGVLTDGGVYIDEEGREMRRFNIKDGAGIKRLQAAGIPVAIISSAAARPVESRARTLGVTDVFVGARDKVEVADRLRQKYALQWEQIGFVGDDVADLDLLRRVGFPVAVGDAIDEVKSVAKLVLERAGGHGAVRELSDLLVQRIASTTTQLNVPSI